MQLTSLQIHVVVLVGGLELGHASSGGRKVTDFTIIELRTGLQLSRVGLGKRLNPIDLVMDEPGDNDDTSSHGNRLRTPSTSGYGIRKYAL